MDRDLWLAKLNEMALAQAALKPEQNLADTILAQISELVGARFVTFSEYDAGKNMFFTRNIKAEEPVMALGVQLLGKNFMRTAAASDGDYLRQRVQAPIAIFHTLTEVSNGVIHQRVSTAFRALTGIDRLICLTHLVDGQIYGLSVAGLRRDQPEPDMAALSFFSAITAISIRRNQVEDSLRKSLFRTREIIRTARNGIIVLNRELVITSWNEALEKMNGIPAASVLGRPVTEALPWVSRFGILDRMQRALRGEVVPETEIQLTEPQTGRTYWSSDSYGPLYDADGSISGVIGTIRDVTKYKETEGQLRYMGLHDLLTGLANPRRFEIELDRLSKSREYPVTIMSFDVDGLKLYNDAFGHAGGDKAIQECADLLRDCMREGDVLARMGGDEFAAVFPRLSPEQAEIIADRVRHTLTEKNRNAQLPLSLSIGIATAEDKGESLTELVRAADERMYREKLNRSRSNRSQLIESLLAALSERDVETEEHSRRMSIHAVAMGKRLGLASDRLNNLELLTRVHDIGKVGIPDAILRKNGPLTESEWEVMRQHPERGYRIAESSRTCPRWPTSF
jgi:diguanylate cyclase (GGDEF)-like protein/PAS domain S-box-containing protein